MKRVNQWRDAVAKVGLFLVGLGSFTYGAWLMYRPAGYLIGGLLAVALALLLDKSDTAKS